MVDRVNRRWLWWTHQGQVPRDAMAAAWRLVERRHCANLRCEDGVDLDAGERCTVCDGGRSQRRPAGPAAPAAAAAQPVPRPRPYDRTVAEALARPADPGDPGPARPAPPGRCTTEAAQQALATMRARLAEINTGRRARAAA